MKQWTLVSGKKQWWEFDKVAVFAFAVVDLYLMFIAVCYALEIKEQHTEEYYHYGHGDLSGGVSRVLYGYWLITYLVGIKWMS